MILIDKIKIKLNKSKNKKCIDSNVKKQNEISIVDLNNFWNLKKDIISKIIKNNYSDKKIFEKIKYDKIEKWIYLNVM